MAILLLLLVWMTWAKVLVAILPVTDFDDFGATDSVLMVILNWWWWWPWHWWQYTWWLILVPGCLVTYLVTYALFPNSLEEPQAHSGWGTRRLIISRGPCWHPTNCPHTQSANISHHIEEFTIFGACLLRFKSVPRVFWILRLLGSAALFF